MTIGAALNWFEPKSIGEWAKRAFTLRPIVVSLAVLSILVSEFRFDWIEQMLGRYMAATNIERPESGAIWEIGHKIVSAQQELEKIVANREAFQRMANAATSFAEITSGKAIDQGVMVSSDHFRKMYLGLPPEIAREIISPFDLIRLYSRGQVVRFYLLKNGDGLEIYLIDEKNSVKKRLSVSADILHRLQKRETVNNKQLEDMDRFRNRTYPADHFFDLLDTLPEEVSRHVISRPEMLLQISGVITRIGVSDETVDGFIEIGFEVQNGEGLHVILMNVPEWAVWRLRMALELKTKPATSISRQRQESRPWPAAPF